MVESPDPETLTLRLLSVSAPATMGAQSTAVLGIQDNDGGGTVRFSSASYSVTEGTSTATLTVLRANGAGNVTVPWTLGGSAILNTDYGGPTSGELEFGPKQTSASLPIRILNDTLVDGLKNLVVTLGAPSGGATLGSPSVATLGIKDNEPSVRFSSADLQREREQHSVGVTVIRDGSTGSTVTVKVKTTGTEAPPRPRGPLRPRDRFHGRHPARHLQPGSDEQDGDDPVMLGHRASTELETIGLVLDNVDGRHSRHAERRDDPDRRERRGRSGPVRRRRQQRERSSGHGQRPVVTRAGGSASGLKVHWTITGGTAVHDGAPGPGVDYTGATSGVVVFEPERGQPVDPDSRLASVRRPGAALGDARPGRGGWRRHARRTDHHDALDLDADAPEGD